MSDLSRELRQALDDPRRYEWGEGPWEHLGDAERDVRRLLDEIEVAEAALSETRRALEAIRDEHCNGCGRPRREWGPVCGGMTTGDMTHFHSASWWIRRALAAADGGTTTFQGVPIVVDPDMPEGTFELRKLKGGGTGQEQQP